MIRDFKSHSQFANAAWRNSHIGISGFWFEKLIQPDWMATITFEDHFDRNGRLRSPHRGWAMAALKAFFDELERAAGGRIAWILVVDVGRIGNRVHAHALVAGVAHLNRRFWWEKAFRQFGRTRIEPYVEKKGGAQYTAKHALTDTSELHFGGGLLNPKNPIEKDVPVGRVVVAKSADVPSSLFKMASRRGKRQ